MQTGLRLTFFVLFMGFASALIAQTLVISGVVDFEALGNPEEAGIELYATHDIYDLSEYGLGSPSNGNGDNGVEFTFPADTIFEGECIYFTYNQISFLNFFGFSVDYTNSVPSFLGDDVVQLFFQNQVIDQYGLANSSNWHFEKGWAYRNDFSGPNYGDFKNFNWIKIEDVFDGIFNNDGSDTPFPLCTYTNQLPEFTETQFAKTLQRTNEGLGVDSFSISNLQPESCTFDVVVLPSGTATMGEDFLLDSITSVTTNNSGSLNYYIPVTILEDTLIEASETIDLLIQNFSGDPGCSMGEDSMMTIKIIDNEYLSLTLDEALERDSSGNLIFLGELIQIEASNQCIDMNGDGGHELYVQDDSSAIMLYSETILLTSYLSQGTKLRAQGFLSESNGLPILLLEDIEDIGYGQFYDWDWYTSDDTLSFDKIGQRIYLPYSSLNPQDWTPGVGDPGFFVGGHYPFGNQKPLYTFIDKEFYFYNLPYPFHQGIGGICLPFNDSLQTLYQEELFIMPCFWYFDMMVIESTNDPILNTQVTIFPNPASDQINIEIEDLNPQSIRVYNALGQLELLELNPQAQMQINVSNLISGMHYLEITFEQGTVVKPVMIR